jgi:putative tryptophan/tyrosine transport system substrate-binding protein
MSAKIKRRDFITLLGGAAAAWPLAARAQQSTRKHRIAVLMAMSESDPEAKPRVKAFEQGLQDWGWVKEQNLIIDYRWIGADVTQIQSHAAEIVRSSPELIIANSTPVLAALRQETRAIPLVFVQVIDPVTRGFVATLARPGGNITGFTNFEFPMGSKWVEIPKEIAPIVAHVATIYNPQTAPYGEELFRQIKVAGFSLTLEAIDAPVRQPADLQRTIVQVAAKPHGGLIVIPDAFTSVHRDLIVELAAQHRLPAIYPFRYFAVSGGLVSYGVDSLDIFRRSASYVDRILKGESPSELPVQAPTKFELVINLKTAKSLGLDVPSRLLALADEVIE